MQVYDYDSESDIDYEICEESESSDSESDEESDLSENEEVQEGGNAEVGPAPQAVNDNVPRQARPRPWIRVYPDEPNRLFFIHFIVTGKSNPQCNLDTILFSYSYIL